MTMTDPSLLLRLNALLDRPQEYLVYSGGEGGEYISHRIGLYSSKYRHGGATKLNYNASTNRSLVVYPEIYQHIVNRLPFDVGDRAALINMLVAAGVVTDQNLTHAEEFFDLSGVPLFRMHRVAAEHFQQHPTHFLITFGLWRAYARVLTVIKVRGTLDQFLEHVKVRWNLELAGEHSVDEVRDYMQAQGIEEASFIVYRALIIKKLAQSLGVEETFALTTGDLYHGYFDQVFPEAQAVLKNYARHAGRHGGRLLDLSRVVNDPRYLADQFDIEDFRGFHQGIVAWHHANLDLMLAHGFTEFETLRIG